MLHIFWKHTGSGVVLGHRAQPQSSWQSSVTILWGHMGRCWGYLSRGVHPLLFGMLGEILSREGPLCLQVGDLIQERPCWAWPSPPKGSGSLVSFNIIQKLPKRSFFITQDGMRGKQAFLQFLVSSPTINQTFRRNPGFSQSLFLFEILDLELFSRRKRD